MLPQKNRLKKDKDFEQVFKKGKFFREDFLRLGLLLNNLNNNRFGFIVSAKVSKKAVLRNKIKRWLSAAVLLHSEILKKNQLGVDVVVIVQPKIVVKNFQTIAEVIKKLFIKVKI